MGGLQSNRPKPVTVVFTRIRRENEALMKFDRARSEMLRRQLRPRGITEPRVLDAMAVVPRHHFVPELERSAVPVHQLGVSGGRDPRVLVRLRRVILGGDFDEPTQPRTLTPRQKAARRRAIREGKFQMVRKGAATRGRGQMIANPRSYKQGYDKGRKDYRSPKPTPASQLKQRTMSYQFGYLEGYADAADKKYSKPRKNTRKRRKNSRRRRR